MTSRIVRQRLSLLGCGIIVLSSMSGCVATRGWVREQITPLREQVAEVEGRQHRTAVTTAQVAGQVTRVETHLNQTTNKAELALKNLENLRLERNFALGVKEGTNFATGTAALTSEAQHAIDEFLYTLQGTEGAIFLVTGHTDNLGSEQYNQALGQKRAASVAQYLITQKGIDPLRVTTVSYGEQAPLADNSTSQGRYKNRRVEILVYTETVTSTPGKHRLELERTSHR
jgi:outer membrane protein OmpA-like peptidoglycan-associated protein